MILSYRFWVLYHLSNAYCIRFFWQICEEDRVKSMVEGLDKKSLVRGLNTSDVFQEGSDKEEGKKVSQLIQNGKDMMGSNDNWASKIILFISCTWKFMPRLKILIDKMLILVVCFSKILHCRSYEFGEFNCYVFLHGLLPW